MTHGAGVIWPRLQGDDIFVAVAGKTAKAVRKNQLALAGAAWAGRGRAERVGVSAGTTRLQNTAVFQLFRQRSLLIVQDEARHGLQQHAVFVGDLFEAPDKDAARLVEHLRFDA